MEEKRNTTEVARVSRKIVSIAAGEAHTLALSGDGRVYSWGRGFFGRLGTGSEADRLSPARIYFYAPDDEREDKVKIVGIAAGAYHSLALADDGSIWGWGYNIYGQIGVAGENYSSPRLLEGLLESQSASSSTQDPGGKPLKVSSVSAGGMMSLAVDNGGAMWMWGNCPNSSQSQPSEEDSSLASGVAPVPVCDFHGRTVFKVACGNDHVVALVSAEEKSKGSGRVCYSWGGNSHGQLGLGDRENRLHPEIIEAFNIESPWEIYDIACGASHTAVLAKRKKPGNTSENGCWTFGLGDNGQLGHGTTQALLTPELIKGLPQNLVSVDCGLYHSCVVSSSGEVWSWGMEKGLGLCPDSRFTGAEAGDALTPLMIPFGGLHGNRFSEPLQVACGAAHTVLVADAGYKLWSWGRGRSGVLGNGRLVDCYAPTAVLWPLVSDDFKEEESNNASLEDHNKEKIPEDKTEETDKRLSAAMEEIKLLQSKLSMMERYAGILHGAVFGKPLLDTELPVSLRTSGAFDIAKEWESMLEESDERKLIRLQMFYRDMLTGVKDKLMKKRIQEVVKEYLNSSAKGTTEN
ncbi:ultraviolet-B receptor UVR8 [Andrographis paniculata]|uniref:ultraviolet-B receptor UVR8 n=1 Tax=Andrographis paniculata TaxID=175694 RepID=UPI0021E75ACD|nr:ultraviolet-B receptor UVR8 [Andrographis paniculata]